VLHASTSAYRHPTGVGWLACLIQIAPLEERELQGLRALWLGCVKDGDNAAMHGRKGQTPTHRPFRMA
jgi:hypothetical protein